MKTIITSILLFVVHFSFGQGTVAQQQYFDGADTSYNPVYGAILIDIDTVGGNAWQVGVPQKAIFDSAATHPNVLLTDTTSPYPPNDTSSFSFHLYVHYAAGVQALQWKQKIDFENNKDGGRIEFSADSGQTWHNVFDNPFTYNFYGFDSTNVDTLFDGQLGFTGTDSVWRDVWLCFDNSWMFQNNGIKLRFVLLSDSVETNQEGWMIDNLLCHRTFIHTIVEKNRIQYFKVYPNPAQDRLYIDIKKLNEYHIIEHMTFMDAQGRQLQEWKNVPTHFFIDTKAFSNGNYFLKIRTNKSEETLSVVIQH